MICLFMPALIFNTSTFNSRSTSSSFFWNASDNFKIRASERRGGYDDGWNAGRIEGEAAGKIAGRIEGEAIGKLEERKSVILEILEQKGKITEVLKEKIQNQNDMTVLKDWLQKACTIESIEEFEKRIWYEKIIADHASWMKESWWDILLEN